MPEAPQQAPGQASQPPFGSSPATGPSPNKGYEAAGLQRLGSIVKQLEELIPTFGAATEPGKACLDALKTLVKWVPAGSVTPASQRNNIEQMSMQNTQQNAQMQAIQAQRKPQVPGGAPSQAQAA